MRPGTVALVGAGPGNPGLLTVRGRRLLRRADVVVYDRLVDRRLLDLVPGGAERVGAAGIRFEVVPGVSSAVAAPAPPVALIQAGTTAGQATVAGTLADIAAKAARRRCRPRRPAPASARS